MDVFLAAIRDWFNNPDRVIGDNITLESAEGLGNDTAVILCRYWDSPIIYGHRYRLAGYAALTNSRESAALAWEAIGEISEPPGAGHTLNVDWADGKTADPAAIRWVGEGRMVAGHQTDHVEKTPPADPEERSFGTYWAPRNIG